MAQVFLHYVNQNGPFTHHKDDNYFDTGFQNLLYNYKEKLKMNEKKI